MEEEVFLNIQKYINENKNSVLDLIQKYYDSKSYHFDYDGFLNVFPQILYSLYEYILRNDYLKSLRDRIKNDTEKNLVYIYFHAAIPVTISFEKGPKEFFRKFLIPIRSNLSDIMYFAIASLRCSFKKDLFIESGAYSFVSYRYYEDMEYTYLASDYQALGIYDLDNPKLLYGIEDPYIFDISLNYIRLLDDNKSKENGILLDAKGYGIFEDNLDAVIKAVNPMYLTKEDANIDLLGIDFDTVDFDILKIEVKEKFELARYHYEANSIEE